MIYFFVNRILVRYFSRQAALLLPSLLIVLFLFSSPAFSADVLILADTQYKPVADIAFHIKSTLRASANVYAVSDVRGRLSAVIESEGANIVVALGNDAVNEALRLPSSIPIVYGLVIVPPQSPRANITGVCMSTPVSEYVATVRKYLPKLSKISVVGSTAMINNLVNGNNENIHVFNAISSSGLVDTVNGLSEAHSLLLLPDVNLLSTSVMQSVYLFSFRNNIPLLGISEVNVKQGSLFALVFDSRTISQQISEKVKYVLRQGGNADLQVSYPRKYNLYINTNTAKKMGINLPEEMLRRAKKIYQ